MSRKLQAFVSSVQHELEHERVVIQNLLNTDAFLSAHVTPVLYEFEPASPEKALEGCLKSLEDCEVYLLIVGTQYGTLVGKLAITHLEYRHAKRRKLPILAFIKGDRSVKRESGTEALLEELDTDGPKYKRFRNVIELQKEVRAALVKLLKDQFGIAPSTDENDIAEHTIEATSPFESQPLTRLLWKDLDHGVMRRLIASADDRDPAQIPANDLLTGAALRGLVWRDSTSGDSFATAAGIVLLAKDPSAVFPQCRILADAYRGTEPDGAPSDHEDIRNAMPLAVDRAIAFVDRNTRHPMRVVGLNRVRLDEYPVEALREALVNAVAHRQYEDAGRKIMLEVFADRVVISSPGLPPAPITLAKLRKGTCRPCSRNPVLAQCLSYFHRIEERGSGFRRMRDQMLDHGLEPVLLGTDAGYFQVTFAGPGDNLERIRVPASAPGRVVPPLDRKQTERATEKNARVSGRRRKTDERALRTGIRGHARYCSTGLQLAHGPGVSRTTRPWPFDQLCAGKPWMTSLSSDNRQMKRPNRQIGYAFGVRRIVRQTSDPRSYSSECELGPRPAIAIIVTSTGSGVGTVTVLTA